MGNFNELEDGSFFADAILEGTSEGAACREVGWLRGTAEGKPGKLGVPVSKEEGCTYDEGSLHDFLQREIMLNNGE